MIKTIIPIALLPLLLAACNTPISSESSMVCGEWEYMVHEFEAESAYKVSEQEFWTIAPNKRYIKRDDQSLHLYIHAQDPQKGSGSFCEDWTYTLFAYEWINSLETVTHEREVSRDRFWAMQDKVYFSRDGCTLRELVELEELR